MTENKIIKTARFITIEGLDGSGKSTQAKMLSRRLCENSIKNICDFEPTDREIGRQIREILSGRKKADPRTMALLFAADRIEHITGQNGILENLKNGVSVISDRYYFSSYSYQMTDMPLEWVMQLNSQAKSLAKPDMHVFIDVSPELCLERICKNRSSSDIFENKKSLTAARENFMKIFDLTKGDETVVAVDGNSDPQSVCDKVFECVKPLFF